jgi:hypothetical protein
VIFLTTTTDLIQLVTSGTQVLKVHASYLDSTGVVVTPGRQNTSIPSAGTTTIVGSPVTAGVSRNVKFISIYNTDTTSPNTITVQHFVTGTPIVLQTIVLYPGLLFTYNDTTGWRLSPAW